MEEDVVMVNRIHPNEHHIGDQVDRLFAEGPIPGVRLITRYVPEDAREQRGLVPGSNTILRQGNPHGDLDEQFLWEVAEAAQHARVVLDVHGHRRREASSYPFYGELARHNQLATGVASLLRFEGVLVHPKSLYLAARLPHYVGWDLAPGTDIETFRPLLEKLGTGWCPPTRPMAEYLSVGSVSAADGTKYGFKEEYELFEPLPSVAVAQLGLPRGSCAGGWSASLYGHTGHWGEVVVPLPKGAH